jgi:hypothetical protein
MIATAVRCRHQPRSAMNVVNGLPAHVLLVHFMVVLVALTAVLEIACALWPAVRRGQLMWLTLILAIMITVLTPITANAGGWLYDLRRNPVEIPLRPNATRRIGLIWAADRALAPAALAFRDFVSSGALGGVILRVGRTSSSKKGRRLHRPAG